MGKVWTEHRSSALEADIYNKANEASLLNQIFFFLGQKTNGKINEKSKC